MKQTLSLLKVIFKQNYRKSKGAERSKKGKVGMVLLYIFCAVVLLPYLFVSLFMLAKFAIASDAGLEYMSILMLAIQSFALIFGTISLVNVMFLSKDNEIIASLPIPTRRIFTAKFLYVLIHELVLGMVIGFSGVGIYGVLSHAPISFYLLGALAVIVAPILALAISSIFLLPIIMICSQLRKYPVVSGILSMIFACAGMFVYMAFITGISSGAGDGLDGTMSSIFAMLGDKLVFNMVVAEVVFLTAETLPSLLFSVLIYGGLFAIACVLTSLVYRKASTLVTEQSTTGKIKISNRKNGVIKSLVMRDVKSIVRFPMLLLMCASQILFAPITVFIFSAIYTGDMAEMLVPMMFFMGTMLACGTNGFASTSFSRENNNINILKTLPVSGREIITSKLALSVSSAVATAVLTTVACLVSGIDLLFAIVFFAFLLLFSIGMCAMQTKSDLDKPKLGWTNVNEGLKNNKAAMLPMFVAMGVGMLGMFALLFLAMAKPALVIIVIALLALLAGIFAILQLRSLYKNADRLLGKIEY